MWKRVVPVHRSQLPVSSTYRGLLYKCQYANWNSNFRVGNSPEIEWQQFLPITAHIKSFLYRAWHTKRKYFPYHWILGSLVYICNFVTILLLSILVVPNTVASDKERRKTTWILDATKSTRPSHSLFHLNAERGNFYPSFVLALSLSSLMCQMNASFLLSNHLKHITNGCIRWYVSTIVYFNSFLTKYI